MHQPSIPERFYSLDVLRGVGALSVVLWHWQHFFAPLNPRGVPPDLERLPFFPYLSFFYRHGFTAVELFFCLSGFVFFWLYGAAVGRREISFGRFAMLRLSRLYPLHIATLLFVAVAQQVYWTLTQRYFVYQGNDLYHFILNLLFVSSWGFQTAYSFNAPIWSVSVEIFLYGVFFVLCRQIRPRIPGILLAIGAGGFLLGRLQPLGLGVVFFYLGGLSFVVYKTIIGGAAAWLAGRLVPLLTLACWAGAVWAAGHAPQIELVPALRYFGTDIFGIAIYLLFPLTVLSLALLETRRGSLGRRAAFIGDLTYSSYLLHFPLQLVLATAVTMLSIPPEVFYSRRLFLGFAVVLLAASWACFHWFEIPVQRWIRKRYAAGAPRRDNWTVPR
jgi:peptidoglycan/LPS O-acetylase OafA/YrhL